MSGSRPSQLGARREVLTLESGITTSEMLMDDLSLSD